MFVVDEASVREPLGLLWVWTPDFSKEEKEEVFGVTRDQIILL